MGSFFNHSAPENTGWVEENVYFGREIPFHEGVFRDLVFHPSQQCEEDERRAPLKTPVWEDRGQGAGGIRYRHTESPRFWETLPWGNCLQRLCDALGDNRTSTNSLLNKIKFCACEKPLS